MGNMIESTLSQARDIHVAAWWSRGGSSRPAVLEERVAIEDGFSITVNLYGKF